MGCMNSKPEHRHSTSGIQYVPPGPAITTHQPAVQEPDVQILETAPPRNGSLSYDYGMQSSNIPPPVVEEDSSLFVTRYAYQARTAEDLSFEKGEKLRVSSSFIIHEFVDVDIIIIKLLPFVCTHACV